MGRPHRTLYPGLGYVVAEEVREPLRVCAGYIDDDEIGRIACEYAAPGN
ncbi:hypothetical protein [Saccharopolyspora shandongensis]